MDASSAFNSSNDCCGPENTTKLQLPSALLYPANTRSIEPRVMRIVAFCRRPASAAVSVGASGVTPTMWYIAIDP
jgi:hypothetical protein